METICINYFKGANITDDDEDIIIDYLSDHNINVSLDMKVKDMCLLALNHKHGNVEKNDNFDVDDRDNQEIIEINKYGDLSIDVYLNIAMNADDRTLLQMMSVSKRHMNKFNNIFFKNYLIKNYPYLIKYRPMEKSFKEYYLKVIYAIDMLRRNYNYEYDSTMDKNILQIYKDVERINSLTPMFVNKYLERHG